MGRLSTWIFLGLTLLAVSLHEIQAEVPSENECRPYIEKAIHDLKAETEVIVDDSGNIVDGNDDDSGGGGGGSSEEIPTITDTDDVTNNDEPKSSAEENDSNNNSEEVNDDDEAVAVTEDADNAADSTEVEDSENSTDSSEDNASSENNNDEAANDEDTSNREKREASDDEENVADDVNDSSDDNNDASVEEIVENDNESGEKEDGDSVNSAETEQPQEEDNNSAEEQSDEKNSTTEDSTNSSTEDEVTDNVSGEASDDNKDDDSSSDEVVTATADSDENADVPSDSNNSTENNDDNNESSENSNQKDDDSSEARDDSDTVTVDDSAEQKTDEEKSDETENDEDKTDVETASVEEDTTEVKSTEENDEDNKEEGNSQSEEEIVEPEIKQESIEETESTREKRSASGEEDQADNSQDDSKEKSSEVDNDEVEQPSAESEQDEATAESDDQTTEESTKESDENIDVDSKEESGEDTTAVTSESTESFPEDDLLMEFNIPTNLRDHSHVNELLRLDVESDERETAVNKAADVILKDLKRIYENAIKPLETLYKYRDLSNRHFSDPEIFSKPLVLFMGPWSGGKSTILNYLTDNEYTPNSLRTGAEPSPAYFNILMHGDEPEVLDGTELAADWTFSGLQKFGQGLEDRLRGQKLPHKLLEKVNIVEIPGILEVRKQVSRLFPFNDACQWFIDRADIIFLVYDPSKLDVGPETEAILDQLKGREYQTRILLNKADQVKPEELLRVQGALIWNISPLMSSAQPPVMYTTSLWSHPYETGAPVRLLQAQERAFLRDLRNAIDKRIDNKIASARRFAVRVRNHAKMVDCYLTTYYNHKTLFGNKKQIAENIIQNPQNYHIYEGLSTLTNISRYDLPDPDVYRDFFRLNSLYEFKKLSETCTYFRGCPINKLDVAIAYDLPELGGKYKKLVESALLSLDATDSKNASPDKS